MDGDGAGECSRFHRADDEVVLKRYAVEDLLARAGKAEAERDAMRRAWDSLTAELRLSRFAALRDLVNRHTPEG